MSFLSFLFTLLIEPLELLFESIYMIAERMIGNPGLSIIALSLSMNFLVLPLYRRADALQLAQQETEKKLEPYIAHIKKVFKSDERFLMLQEFYRQNGYKPSYALRGSLPLLLEIPFFIAAYRFLSSLSLLRGVSFGPIKDLGAEDGLIVIGSLAINLLPVLMTAINIVSGAIYTKGMTMKSKMQLYGMALVFLVFLYKSPSGLVFYWTLNNIFSLVKNIFYKLKNPGLVLKWLAAICGAAFIGVFAFVYPKEYLKRRVIFIFAGLVMIVPLIVHYVKGRKTTNDDAADVEEAIQETVQVTGTVKAVFLLSVIGLAVLCGLVVPASVIKASTSEFVEVSDFANPLNYVFHSTVLAFGVFVVWVGIFYKLAEDKGKRIFAYAFSAGLLTAVFNYMVYGKAKSNISSLLHYDLEPVFSIKKQIINMLLVILIFVAAYFIFVKLQKLYPYLLLVILLSFIGMGIYYGGYITDKFSKLNYIKEQSDKLRNSDDQSVIHLSKNGKNVVILMMDRAIGAHIPYIMEERPDLMETFDGFTYYHNTISYGRTTNFGAPALYGGYEYTPKNMNARTDKKLGEKHDEALLVMPVTFLNQGYDVNVCEPPLAGYQWIPDLSIYDDYPGIKTTLTNKRLDIFGENSGGEAEMYKKIRNRNFFCLGLTKAAPLFMQESLYNGGLYNSSEDNGSGINPVQVTDGISKSKGVDVEFLNSWNVMNNLSRLTKVSDDNTNCFNMFSNEMTHQPVILQKPDYVPSQEVDNTPYDEGIETRYVINGIHMHIDNADQAAHYDSNMSAILLIGKWLDYLREEGVYDNTRIIIVSDHGRDVEQFDELILEDGRDAEQFAPLLMVKDFNAKGYEQSEKFMTNGDVPTFAFSELVENPVNPFTGNPINSDAKLSEAPEVLSSGRYDIYKNNGTAFQPGWWYSVNGNLYDKSCWKYLGKY